LKKLQHFSNGLSQPDQNSSGHNGKTNAQLGNLFSLNNWLNIVIIKSMAGMDFKP